MVKPFKPPQSFKPRQRNQLSVTLGEHEVGARRHALLVAAAERAKQPNLSKWVVSVLMRAAGSPLPEDAPTRAEMAELEKRVEWLEAHNRLMNERP